MLEGFSPHHLANHLLKFVPQFIGLLSKSKSKLLPRNSHFQNNDDFKTVSLELW